MAEPKGRKVTAKDHARSIAEDYGRWVATEDIYHDGALAYAAGHPVPHSNVERHGYDQQGVVEPTKPGVDHDAEGEGK